MTAKQDLIAAALTLADTHPGDIGGIYHAQKDLREMCARAMVQPVGDVPMPQSYVERPIDYTGGVWIESQMRTYGKQCWAAGYAAGVAASGKDAERYRWLRDFKFKYNGHCLKLSGHILWEESLDAAIDAALAKEEVKP